MQGDHVRPIFQRLLIKQIRVGVRGESHDPETFGEQIHQIESALPDRTGRTQDG